jgi:hypothetical protein
MTDLTTEIRGSNPGRDKVYFLLHIVQTGSVTKEASYPMGMGCCCPGSEQSRHKADYSSQSSVDVKNGWSKTLFFMG